MKVKVIFKESQRFNKWWVWLIIVLSLACALGTFIYYDVAVTNANKLIPMLLLVVLILFIFVIRLKTEITEKEIIVQFFPLVKKRFLWQDILQAQVVDYGFVGGWGIRLWTSYGTVYNVSGSKGMHLKINGKQYVIGTQKEQELRSSVAHLLK